ncbi:MAG: hypothetical protein IKU39_03070 [Lachnospiraceae bacterium]|nr:hypothetical protein [Lachnospiraceae bacterium]
MEQKEIKAIVDKEYKLLVISGLLAVFYISVAVASELQGIYPSLNVDFWMPLFALVLLILFAVVLDKFVDFKEELTVNFYDDEVILRRGKKVRCIPYKKMKMAEKSMIINRTYQDKGKYRVIIKCREKNCVMYSGEDSDLKLDFEATEISKVYFELKRRGIKCC